MLCAWTGSGDVQQQAFTANTPRTQSFINNQQRQLLHKLFSKGSLPSQYSMLPDVGQQGMDYQQQSQPQAGYNALLQQSQQYLSQQQLLQHQQQAYPGAGLQNMADTFKAGRGDSQHSQQQQQQHMLQQPTYNITAQAYDAINYAQQQYGGAQPQHQGVLTRGQSFALGQHGLLTRGQSFANGQQGVLTRGQSFVNGQQGVLTRGQSLAQANLSAEQAMEAMIESPRTEVLVTPNFSSQELNMLLEVSDQFCEE